jgi:hypothetical protein
MGERASSGRGCHFGRSPVHPSVALERLVRDVRPVNSCNVARAHAAAVESRQHLLVEAL